MKTNRKFSAFLGLSLLVSIIQLLIIPSFACADKAFTHPDAIIFKHPIYVSTDQVSDEYKIDPAKADAMYKGNRLVFNNVEVEEVHSIYYQSGGAIAVPMVDYFRAGIVRFELMDARGVQQRVQAGYILILDGICQGMVGSFVRMTDCWVGSVKGDLGIGLPPVGQY